MKDSTYLLADFGICSKIIQSNTSYDILEGDKAYMPLEVFHYSGETNKPLDLCKVDVFSFGMILLQMMTGIDAPKTDAEWRSIRSRDFAISVLKGTSYSEKLKGVVCSCMDPVASQRPTFASILSEIKEKKDYLQVYSLKRETARLEKRLIELKNASIALPDEEVNPLSVTKSLDDSIPNLNFKLQNTMPFF